MDSPDRIHCDRHSAVATDSERVHDPMLYGGYCVECLSDLLKTEYSEHKRSDGKPLSFADMVPIFIAEKRPKAVGYVEPKPVGVGTGS